MPDEPKAFVNLENGRTPDQIELMRRIKEDGVCPFCIEHLRQYHPKPILRETDWWVVTENMSPYEGARVHYIFVYKPGHITRPNELPAEALVDLFALVDWAGAETSVLGGAFLMRFGDTAYNGASVDHLHAHLVATEANGPDMEGVRVKIGFKKKSGA